MPGGGGIEAIAQIREKKSGQRILIITIYPEEQYAIRVMKAGASGFLNKDIAPDELVKAVQSILDGKKYIQPSLAEKLTSMLGKDTPDLPHKLLSEREMEVMLRLASGESVSEIARQLSLTPNTVSTYRTRILAKMDMNSNAGLIQYAIEHRLI
jgi:DNA-binding NarL/FixJ family response regulator